MRRFLISYQYNVPGGFGFGSVYHERETDTLPNPLALQTTRQEVADRLAISRHSVALIAISEVSSQGEVVV